MDRRVVTLLVLGLLALGVSRRMRQRPPSHAQIATDPRVLPIGMYAGQPPLPQQIGVTRFDELQDSMLGAAGIEQSGRETDATATYYGTDTVPAPVYPSGRVNRPIDLEMADLEVPLNTPGPETSL